MADGGMVNLVAWGPQAASAAGAAGLALTVVLDGGAVATCSMDATSATRFLLGSNAMATALGPSMGMDVVPIPPARADMGEGPRRIVIAAWGDDRVAIRSMVPILVRLHLLGWEVGVDLCGRPDDRVEFVEMLDSAGIHDIRVRPFAELDECVGRGTVVCLPVARTLMAASTALGVWATGAHVLLGSDHPAKAWLQSLPGVCCDVDQCVDATVRDILCGGRDEASRSAQIDMWIHQFDACLDEALLTRASQASAASL